MQDAEEKLIRLKEKEKLMTCDEVFGQFENFLHKTIQKWSGQYDYNDLFQIASIGLIKAYKTYDISKNLSFITYLATIVENELRMYHRKESKHERPLSLYETVNTDAAGNELILIETLEDEKSEDALENIMLQDDLQKLPIILKKLSDRDKAIIEDYYLNGLNQRQIAEKLNISQSYISRVIPDILSRLNKLYKTEGVVSMESKIKREELLELCKVHGTGAEAHKIIAEKFGVSHHTVRCNIHKLGVAKELKEEIQENKLAAESKPVERINSIPEVVEKEPVIENIPIRKRLLRPVLLKGDLFDYEIGNGNYTISNENNEYITISSEVIDQFINELMELKCSGI